MHPKIAQTKYGVLDLIRERWSPRAYAATPIAEQSLKRILEAASWAASSMNEQPWRIILGIKEHNPDTYQKIYDCLLPMNQMWAKLAPVLMVVCSKKSFTLNGAVNRSAQYDCGAAVSMMSLQAIHEDLYMRQMAGISHQAIVDTFEIPHDYEPLVVIALGYLGEPERIEEESRRKSESKTRSRKSLSQFVFGDEWNTSHGIVQS